MVYKRTSQHKVEVLQADEWPNFCRVTQKSSNGLQGHCAARSAIEKSFRDLFNFWGEYPKGVQWKLIYLQSSGVAFAWKWELKEATSELFSLFLKTTGGTDPENFRGICMEDFAAVVDILQADTFFYGIDLVDGSMIGELVRGSVEKHSSTVWLLRYNSHICHVSVINALFKAYRCLSSDQFIKRA